MEKHYRLKGIPLQDALGERPARMQVAIPDVVHLDHDPHRSLRVLLRGAGNRQQRGQQSKNKAMDRIHRINKRI